MRTVVLVHGAWHGPWCWAPVLAGLDERGVEAVPVQLRGPDLAADAAVAAAALGAAGDGQPVVLVGHGYGGAVITEAGDHPAVERLVYLAALAPEPGQSVADLLAAGEPDGIGHVEVGGQPALVLDPARAVELLYADCDPDDAARAATLLAPQPLATFTAATRAAAWRVRPATYVVCGADRAVDPALQRRMAERMPQVSVVEWPTSSHSPWLSRPADVADLLAGLAEEEGEEGS